MGLTNYVHELVGEYWSSYTNVDFSCMCELVIIP